MNTTLPYLINVCNAAGYNSRKSISQAFAKKLLLVCLTMLCFAAAKGQGQTWQALGPDDADQPSSASVQYTNIVTDPNGVPYIVYQDAGNGSKATVMKYSGNSWVTVGAAGISAGAVTYTTLAFNGSTPYVAYRDGGNGGKATVMMFDGSNWVAVGAVGFSTGTVAYTSLAFNGSTPYVAYEDAGNGNKAILMMYNGTNWVAAANPLGAGAATYCSLAFNGGKPYIAFSDAGDSNKARLATYNGSIWVTVGTEISSANTAAYTSLAFNGGNPYVLYADAGNKATVKMYNGSSWVPVGAADFSAGQATYCSLVFNGGTPYVVYRDNGNSNKATVMMYNGSSWVPVGAAGFSANVATYTSLAFSGSTPYVVYEDSGNSNKATVMMYNGSIWVTTSTAGLSAGDADYASLAFIGSTPYVEYVSNVNGLPTLTKYNGSSWVPFSTAGLSVSLNGAASLAFNGSTPYIAYPINGDAATVKTFNGSSWAPVGAPGFSPGEALYLSLAFNGSTPYVAYQDDQNGDNASVMMFDGSNWVSVGPAGFSAGAAFYTSLAVNGSTPYVAYQDWGNSKKATVMTFDGSNWVPVGAAGFSAGTAAYTTLVFNGSTPYVAYEDAGNSNKATVMMYNGSSWVPVGTAGFSAGVATYISLAFNGSTPYVAYEDAGNSNKVTVMMYNGSSWVPVGTAGFSAGTAISTSLAFNGGIPYVTYVSDKVFVKYFGTAPPATQATGVTFSNTTTSASTISWTNGSGTSKAVFMAAATSGSPAPFNLTTYNANAAFASGDQIGSTGWYCIYNGTGSTVNVTGLAAGTTYQVMAVEYNSMASDPAYLTTTGTGNPAGVTTLAPAISITGTLEALSTASGTASSSTSFNVSGVNLSGDITVTAPAGFDVSPDNATWTTQASPSFTITPVSGTIASTPVYIQLDAADAANTYTGNVAITGGGAPEADEAMPASIVSPAPTTITSIVPNSTYSSGNNIAFTVTFATAITGLSASNFSLTAPGITAANISGVGFAGGSTYIVHVNIGSGNGTIGLNLANASGLSPGISTSLPFAGETIIIDQTPPSVTISAPSQSSVTAGTNSVTYTVTYADTNFNTATLSASDITLNSTGGASGSVAVTANSATSYTVTISGITGSGSLGISIGSGTASDLAGNIAPPSGPSATFDVMPTPTTITSIVPNSTYSSGNNIAFTVTFATAITGLSASNFSLTAPGITAANISGVGFAGGSTYIVHVNIGSGNGTIGLNLANASGLSPGISTSLPFAGETIIIDQTPPSVTISAPSQSSVTAGTNSVTYTVTYADTNFNTATLSASDITLNSTGGASGSVAVTANSATSYTVTISGITGLGSLGISINDATATDLAGNIAPPSGPSATFNVVSADATLTNLAISNGTLSPGFNSTVTGYKATVGNGLANINITTTVHDPNATVSINGTTATSGSATAVPLVVGVNNIAIVVTAQDGSTQQTYNLTVTEVQSANDNLASIKTDAGLAQGVTVPSTLTETVVNAVTSITVTPVAADAGASITVNNNAIGGRNPSSVNIPLNQGANTITIVVTAANGAAKTYTLTVTRALEANDKLSNLVVSNGTLSPAFGTATNFNDYVGYGAKLTITPTTADPNATLTVNGVTATSGTPAAVPLVIGNNTVTIIVTAQNGSTKTYTLVVNEARSLNNNLFSIRTSGGLAKGKTVPVSLTETVVPAVSSITVTPTVDDATATVTVSNVAVASGTASVSQPLQMGPNTINIVVTAQNGSIKTYTLTVNRGNAATTDNTVYQPVSVTKPTGDVQLSDDGINVHQGVSPNGDGINDFLQIDNISQYPDNKLSIVNRNGRLIFEAKGYDNTTKTFDGHSNKNGQMQLPGTYFYSLDYTVAGIIKHKTGFLVLKY